MIMPDMDEERKAPSEGPLPAPGPTAAAVQVVESEALLGGRQELLIRHEGRLYRLRRTRLGKLILTA